MIRPTRSIAGRVAVLAIAVAALVAACSSGGGGGATVTPEPSDAAPTPVSSPIAGVPADCPTTQPEPLAAGEKRVVTISTDQGDIEIELDASLSPIAVGNFVALAECGWYDSVIFHRIVPGFVIQGGDGQNGRSPEIDSSLVGTGGPPYTIQDEPVTATYGRGTVAMARTDEPNSVGSQFFIVLDDSAEQALASYNTYQIIGSVTSGMEAVDAIAAVPTNKDGLPNDPVVMNDVSVSTP
jgi:dolichyl-diphosphooligosaccharide---protein glycosyltransferase